METAAIQPDTVQTRTITHINSNVKGLRKPFELTSHVNVLLGSNGAGKTALMNAITLAVFGEAYELGARKSAKSWALLSHLLPKGEPYLFSLVAFDDGSQCSFQAGRGMKIRHTPPPFRCAMPLDSVMSALRGNRETVLDFFLLYYATTLGENRSEEQHGPFSSLFLDLPLPPRVLLQKAEVKAKLRKWRAEVRTIQTMLNRYAARPDLRQALSLEQERAEERARLCAKYLENYQKRIESWFHRNKADLGLGPHVGFAAEGAQLYVTWKGKAMTSGAETLELAAHLIAQAPNRAEFNLFLAPDQLVDEDHLDRLLRSLGQAKFLNSFVPQLTPGAVPSEHLVEVDPTPR